MRCCPHLPSAGAKQAEEILGPKALELAVLYDQLCVIRFLHERMPEAAEAGACRAASCFAIGAVAAFDACLVPQATQLCCSQLHGQSTANKCACI